MTFNNKPDKLLIGLQAGAIATVFKEIGGLISIIVKSSHTYWDYSEILIFNHQAKNWKEQIIAIIIQCFFSIQLAVAYSYFENKFPTKYYLIKGSIFGGTIWFILQGMILMFNVKQLSKHTVSGTWVEFITAIVFGTIVSWWVNKKHNS